MKFLTWKRIVLAVVFLLICMAIAHPLSSTSTFPCPPSGHNTYNVTEKRYGFPVPYIETATGDVGTCIGDASTTDTEQPFLLQSLIIDLVPAGFVLILATALLEKK